jgi:hypothetical protein
MIKVLESNDLDCSKILTQDLFPGDTSIPKLVNIQSPAWREKKMEKAIGSYLKLAETLDVLLGRLIHPPKRGDRT